MLSSRSFIVSGLMFKSLIHFQLTFVYGVKSGSSFILLHGISSFPSIIYWRDSLSPLWITGTLSKYQWSICMGLFLCSLFHSISPTSVFMLIPYYFDYCSFIIYFETESVMPLDLFYFLRIDLTLCSLSIFHMNHTIVFFK